jgi:hypothetical protein
MALQQVAHKKRSAKLSPTPSPLTRTPGSQNDLPHPDHESITQRLAELNVDAAPKWGKMSLAQTLAHCQKPLLVAAGSLELKRGLIGLLFGRMAKKKFITSDAPFNQNSPTDPRFLNEAADKVEQERATLLGLIEGFVTSGPPNFVHPFFGPLNETEWDRLMRKHLDHHLRQFGS